MGEMGLGKLALLMAALAGAYGLAMEGEDNWPRLVVMDSEKACGGMAGFFGCQR